MRTASSAATIMTPIALLLLLLAPAAVEGFATRILRQPSSHSHSHHSSSVNRRARAAGGGRQATATIISPASPSTSTTWLASQRASSDGFGDARGRSAFMDQGRIELLCKAGPDGASLGDCPFCHYVQMVLRYKVRPRLGRWCTCMHVCIRYARHTTRPDSLAQQHYYITQGLKYRLVPLTPEDKPEWLLEGYGGKMPCLVHDEEVRAGSCGVVPCGGWM